MARSPVTYIAGSLVALVAASGCNGKLIHLGDGMSVGDGGDGATCPHAQVNANEVLWIGDSWVLIPGGQHTGVRDAARTAGVIGPGEDYVIGAVAATKMDAIAGQYAAQEASATKVRVLIMDGGTWDTILTNGSAASVDGAASAFNQLLATIASDGTVEHIIYFLMPELPSIPGVAALRPLVQPACAQSAVPCHFVDIQPLWAGHPEYTASEGVFPSDTGAAVVANAIWTVMQQNCIAQ